MWIMQEFSCRGCSKVDELLLDRNEECKFVCNECGDQMEKIISAPRGYVKYSDNPVKQ